MASLCACDPPRRTRPEEELSGGSDRATPNILLVTLDTVRADRLGTYGRSTARTPNLDAVARGGVRFDQAMAAAPLTLPSHATLLTGLLPPHHGLRQNGAGILPAELPTLATVLAAAGYRTGAFVGAFVLDRRFGLARGFAHYDDAVPREPTRTSALAAERPASEVVDDAVAWIARAGDRPLFAWIHLFDAHAPYEPPSELAARHAHPYDAEIELVDRELGRLLDSVEASGVPTLVAIAADHGEALGEHGEATHGLLLYESTLRVPLILRGPGLPAGWTVRAPVSLADLAPTLAALAGVPFPAVDGRDLAAALRARREPTATDLYAETEYPRLFGWSGLAALRRGRMKYVDGPRPELFDLAVDPAEATDLLTPGDPRAPALAATVAAFRSSPRAARPPPLDDEARRQLAALGYVGSDPGTAESSPVPGQAPDPKDRVGSYVAHEAARQALGCGDLATATRELAELVAHDPENPIFRASLAEAQHRAGSPEAALAELRAAVRARPEQAGGWYDLGVALQELDRSSEAIAALAEAVRLDPMDPEAHNALGLTRLAQGQLAAAREAFAAATRLDPRHATAWSNLGNVARAEGDLVAAAAAYERAIEATPSAPDPHNGLGTLEVQQGRPKAALAHFDAALALAPDLVEARLNRAIACELSGRLAEAAAGYRDVLDRSAGSPRFAAQHDAAAQLLHRLESTITSPPSGGSPGRR